MQRRKVLLPEPDGPIMHITSLGLTSRSTPRSTSSLPKFLCTASALTIGMLVISPVFAARHGRSCRHQLRRGRRNGVEGEEDGPEALKRGRRQLAGPAPAEVRLEVITAQRPDRRPDQEPQAGHDQARTYSAATP